MKNIDIRSARSIRTGRGRKKAVEEFRIQNGLWIVAVILAGIIVIILLWRMGFFDFNHH